MARANHIPTKEELKLLDAWVLPIMAKDLGTQITREQFNESYQSWWRGGRGWDRYQMGGTGVSHCIAWYQHVHKPGSKEWRPAIIMGAVLQEAKIAMELIDKQYAEWELTQRDEPVMY